MGSEITLRVEELPRLSKPRALGRKPCADWDEVRQYLSAAAGKWCCVMTLSPASASANALLRGRASYNLDRNGFEYRTRTVDGESRLYARAKVAAKAKQRRAAA